MSSPLPAKRWAAIWLRRLSTDRIARASSTPDKSGLVTYAKVGAAHLIDAVDDTAALLGVAPGMTLADARAVQPHLRVTEADRNADRALLGKFAERCERWSAAIVVDEPDGIFLEISGSAHLFGGEAGLRADILRILADIGLSARVAISDTPYASWALARLSPARVAPAGATKDVLAPLSISALRIDAETQDLLKKLGLKTVASLITGPRPPLSARLGEALACKLDETLGITEAALIYLRPPPRLFAMRRFLEPLLDAQTILIAVEAALQDLTAQINELGLGIRRLALVMLDVSGRAQRLRLGFTQAETDVAGILLSIEERLNAESATYNFEFGVDAIRLDVLETARRDEEHASPISRLVDALSARLGDDAVRAFHPGNDHWPERACTKRPVKAAPKSSSAFFAPAAARPLKLFTRPEPIEVLASVPDGPPRRFKWRRVLHEAAHTEGPERIAPHPLADDFTRDYFCVEDRTGARFWMFREGLYGRETEEPRWFVHGLFA